MQKAEEVLSRAHMEHGDRLDEARSAVTETGGATEIELRKPDPREIVVLESDSDDDASSAHHIRSPQWITRSQIKRESNAPQSADACLPRFIASYRVRR
jgi:hypothetical protein